MNIPQPPLSAPINGQLDFAWKAYFSQLTTLLSYLSTHAQVNVPTTLSVSDRSSLPVIISLLQGYLAVLNRDTTTSVNISALSGYISLLTRSGESINVTAL
jgi:hypothetical protein